jgi:hypothetical protein
MHEIKSFRIFQTAKVIAVMYLIMFAIMAVIEFFAVMGLGLGDPRTWGLSCSSCRSLARSSAFS